MVDLSCSTSLSAIRALRAQLDQAMLEAKFSETSPFPTVFRIVFDVLEHNWLILNESRDSIMSATAKNTRESQDFCRTIATLRHDAENSKCSPQSAQAASTFSLIDQRVSSASQNATSSSHATELRVQNQKLEKLSHSVLNLTEDFKTFRLETKLLLEKQSLALANAAKHTETILHVLRVVTSTRNDPTSVATRALMQQQTGLYTR